MRVYIIDGGVTRNNLDDGSHQGYLIGNEVTTGIKIYWKPDQHFFIHIAHNVWFEEYNFSITIEDKHTQDSLLLQQYPEIHINNSYLLNLISCELDLTSTPFHYKTVLTYEIELPSSGKKVDFN